MCRVCSSDRHLPLRNVEGMTTAPAFSTHDDFVAFLTAFAEAAHQLPEQSWAESSPCDGWTRADVVRHIIDTQAAFLTGHGVEVAAATGHSPAACIDEHIARVVPATKTHWDKGIDGFFGPSTIGETLCDYYMFDLVIHRWDMTAGTDVETKFTADELAWLTAKMDSYGDVMYTEGMFAARVDVDESASDQGHVLARTGRTP